MLAPEVIEKNYKTFVKLCEHLGDRAEAVLEMIDHFGERLVMAPASSREHYHNSYPGGFVDHSLRVLSFAKKLRSTFDLDISDESLIISALFHDFGKVGDLEGDLYKEQDNDWRRENLGENYVVNYDIQKFPNAERGLWVIQHFGVKLTMDEWLAIRLNDGQYMEVNRYYAMSEPTLALIIHMADRLACHKEKGLM